MKRPPYGFSVHRVADSAATPHDLVGSVDNIRPSIIKRDPRDILSRMARRTIYMMLMIVALQFSWSAVSAYCMHETGRAAHHLGHHPHSADSDDVASVLKDKPSLAKKTSAHSHCSYCSHGVWPLDGLNATTTQPRLADAAPMESVKRLSSSYTIPPDRPQWSAAV
jgi:hypothetical protein